MGIINGDKILIVRGEHSGDTGYVHEVINGVLYGSWGSYGVLLEDCKLLMARDLY